MSLNYADYKMKSVQEKECSYIKQVQPPVPFYTQQDQSKMKSFFVSSITSDTLQRVFKASLLNGCQRFLNYINNSTFLEKTPTLDATIMGRH